MIKILIVEDSPTEGELLKYIFKSVADFEVIGHARNGLEGVKLAESLKPDLITMDIVMPVLDGIQAIRQIMSKTPVPIVVISSKLNDQSLNATFNALEAGAVSVLDKPDNITSPKFETTKKYIIDIIRSMAEINVIKRRFNVKTQIEKFPYIIPKQHPKYELIALGASVGGPNALKTILGPLPANFPIPIVIVQHMTKGFINGFAKWLDQQCKLDVKTAEDQETLVKGTVYFAPDNGHLEIHNKNGAIKARIVDSLPVSGFRPSISVLFHSLANTCGKNAIGGLLTGMGNDGAAGLLELRERGGATFIQDPDSAVVFGMAGVAESLGAAQEVIELSQVADYLIKITQK